MAAQSRWVVAATAGLLMASLGCQAQTLRVVRAGGSAVNLLSMPAVHKDMKLTPEQIDKGRALAEQARRELMEYLRLEFPGVDRHQAQDALEKKRAEMEAAQNSTLKQLLSTSQLNRLKQLALQQEGVAGLLRADVSRELTITDSQREKLQEIEEQMQADIQDLYDANSAEETLDTGGAVRVRRRAALKPEAEKKLQTLREKALTEAVQIFTQDQRRRWREMTGEPLRFEAITVKRGEKSGA